MVKVFYEINKCWTLLSARYKSLLKTPLLTKLENCKNIKVKEKRNAALTKDPLKVYVEDCNNALQSWPDWYLKP